MLKDYVPVSETMSPASEIDFVEDMWTDKLLASLPRVSTDELFGRDEYAVIEPYLKNLTKGARILDGGCGRGEWVRLLSSLGFQTTGLDISRKLIDALNANSPGENFQRGDIRNTDFPDDHFDAYLSWGAFEHFELGLSPCLTEACRILKPGGLLFFSVPYASGRLRNRHDAMLVKSFLGTEEGSAGHNKLQFYQWRFGIGEAAREICKARLEPLAILPIHKDEGLRRLLNGDLGLGLAPGSLLEMVLLRVLRQVVPATWVCHMILAIARKPFAAA
jgi:SAM-dependent methyltransferase